MKITSQKEDNLLLLSKNHENKKFLAWKKIVVDGDQSEVVEISVSCRIRVD
jgi:hypothetical protein